MHEPSTVTRFPPQRPVKQIAAAAQALIDLLDVLGGDPDVEDADPSEDSCDAERGAWVEWDRMRGSSKRNPNFTLGDEDDEDCDPAEDDGEDRCNAIDDAGTASGSYDGRPGDAEDAEDGNDMEGETWAHPDDHPAELFIGRQVANANNPPETA